MEVILDLLLIKNRQTRVNEVVSMKFMLKKKDLLIKFLSTTEGNKSKEIK